MFPKNSTTLGETYCAKIRLCVAALLSLGVAILILAVLVPVYDPGANIKKLDYSTAPDGKMTMLIELTNSNRFRGFKYCREFGGDFGFVWLFYKGDDGNPEELGRHQLLPDYQDFGKSMPLDLTFEGLSSNPEILKNQKSIYVVLYLTYWFKIMSWTTNTRYYQWLEVQADLTDTMTLKDVAHFTRIMNFTTAMAA